MDPTPGPGFPTTSPESFLTVYTSVVLGETPEVIGAWLLENAKIMQKSMFFSPSISCLKELSPLHILLLRACSPAGIFNETTKGSFLTQLNNDQEMVDITDFTFQINDYLFAQKVPDEIRPQIVTLMQLAYRKGIRPHDMRVIRM